MAEAETTEDVPNVEEPDTTEADLRAWGLSGQPATWALSTWTQVIEIIRSANRGEVDATAVQQVIDATFPGAGYQAANVTLAHVPVGDFTIESTGPLSIHVQMTSDEDLDLDDDYVQWDWGDGHLQNDGGCPDHDYADPGLYDVRLVISVAGARYGSGQTVDAGTAAEPVEAFDPGTHTVEEVLRYASDHPDEADAIAAAELAGKGRVTIMDKLA